MVEGTETAPPQIETDRARFIGRGRDIAHAAMAEAPLSGTTGTVLDPVFAIRRRVLVPAGGMARVTFWTLVADSSDALLELVDRHRDNSAFERAGDTGLDQGAGAVAPSRRDQRRGRGFPAAGRVHPARRCPAARRSGARIAAGAGPQSGLWAQGISGDLPIVVLQIDDAEDAAQVRAGAGGA